MCPRPRKTGAVIDNSRCYATPTSF